MTTADSTTNTPTSASAAKANSPTHIAYHVRDTGAGQNTKSFWTRIGSAWAHRDGKGFNIQVDCVPLDGRISLRVATEKKE